MNRQNLVNRLVERKLQSGQSKAFCICLAAVSQSRQQVPVQKRPKN